MPDSASATLSPPVPSPGLAPDPLRRDRSRSGWRAQLLSLVRYLAQSEVHTYAFSVAANAILSLFPFIV
ncbi:MAG TPA: YihY/virulence factor BrkB family protein, partial [Acidobacteriaceae bacterium]|nr:YihY/virulence factor BrkB family protein [Acidobacteriaceae bacterium]